MSVWVRGINSLLVSLIGECGAGSSSNCGFRVSCVGYGKPNLCVRKSILEINYKNKLEGGLPRHSNEEDPAPPHTVYGRL